MSNDHKFCHDTLKCCYKTFHFFLVIYWIKWYIVFGIIYLNHVLISLLLFYYPYFFMISGLATQQSQLVVLVKRIQFTIKSYIKHTSITPKHLFNKLKQWHSQLPKLQRSYFPELLVHTRKINYWGSFQLQDKNNVLVLRHISCLCLITNILMYTLT